MSDKFNFVELEKEFKKFRLEEKPVNSKEESCSCSSNQQKVNKLPYSLLEVSNGKMKVKDRRGENSIIKPARLKVLGNCYAKKLKDKDKDKGDELDVNIKNFEDYTSEAFLKMRISQPSSSSSNHNSPSHTEPESPLELDNKPTSSSSSLNCSTQAKLQQQLSSSTELDSISSSAEINELSEFLGFHMKIHLDKCLIDSMYT